MPLLFLGGLLAVGGFVLLMSGGSLYYLLAGSAIVFAGALIWTGRRLGLHVYAVVLLASALWALVEVGRDWWQLLPRLDLWFALGVFLLVLLPRMGSRLHRGPGHGGKAIAASLSVTLIIGLISLTNQPTEIDGFLATGLRPILDKTEAPILRTSIEDWPSYGGTSYGANYSPLDQITPQNAGQLELAWQYHTGDLFQENDSEEYTNELTPLKIGNTLYLCTPHSIAIALDATTGQEKWRFDPQIKRQADGFKSWPHMTCRGVAYYDANLYISSGMDSAQVRAVSSSACPRRIFLPTAGSELIALNADTGKPCEEFANHGHLDLFTSDLDGGQTTRPNYYPTSPPIVTAQLVIVGSHVTDNASTQEPSGVVRAYNVHTGQLVWNWDSGNPEHTQPLAPGQHYVHNSPNVWGLFSADEGRGMVYLPMGGQTPDQWGGGRSQGAEKYSAGIVALDLNSGHVRWNFQFTHHDLWDRDQGAIPSLTDVKTADGIKPALIASTKEGSVYILDRTNGQPIVPVHELPVPQHPIPGDWNAATQPISEANFELPPVKESDMWGVSPFDQLYCRIRFQKLIYQGRYTPPYLDQDVLVSPGNGGVIDWGGVAVDAQRQVLLTNLTSVAFVYKLISAAQAAKMERGTSEGNGVQMNQGAPYAVEISAFLTPWGLPCQAPPWGWVAAMDLSSGHIVWKHKNGTTRDSAPMGIPLPLGVPGQGGMLTTKGGVAFVGATIDNYLRGFDVRNGKELLKMRLPAGGQASPMSYQGKDGRQYVVIMAGGHKSLATKLGDSLMAYALPKQ